MTRPRSPGRPSGDCFARPCLVGFLDVTLPWIGLAASPTADAVMFTSRPAATREEGTMFGLYVRFTCKDDEVSAQAYDALVAAR